ncbi:hypothetical protein GCM10011316_28440 [Roseibium aquae]|uniref:DUF2293 domain-containing protein n=1 Tax=Roseibium aquae TaxID=1323746 RepID=A0A916TNT7_9HYPH|nr:DUF2293 domain-containing protein [Roseibium aquae]GGB54693.1 hypothetical protein GCM10011316_28440 [Roseibium aquae]
MAGTKRQRDIKKALRELFPRITMADAEDILDLASAGHLRHLPPGIAVWQAAISHVRHAHTHYDSLLEDGYDREAARYFVIEDMNDTLQDWGCNRALDPNDTDVSMDRK